MCLILEVQASKWPLDRHVHRPSVYCIKEYSFWAQWPGWAAQPSPRPLVRTLLTGALLLDIDGRCRLERVDNSSLLIGLPRIDRYCPDSKRGIIKAGPEAEATHCLSSRQIRHVLTLSDSQSQNYLSELSLPSAV